MNSRVWATIVIILGTGLPSLSFGQDCQCVGSTRDTGSSIVTCPKEPGRTTTQDWTVYCPEAFRHITTSAVGACRPWCRGKPCTPRMGIPVVSGVGSGCEWKQVNSNMSANPFCPLGCYESSRNIFLVGCNSCVQECDPTNQWQIYCGGFGAGGWGDWTCGCLNGQPLSPIVLSLSDNRFEFTDPVGGVQFDLDADGALENVAWTAPDSDDVFLALDRNGNGTVDDGAELFGDATRQPGEAPHHGFKALAVFDTSRSGGNGDGFISEQDAVFARLLLWSDSNHDGRSQTGELRPLRAAGVDRISLDYRSSRRKDRHGNLFRYIADVWVQRSRAGHSVKRKAIDVFLQVGVSSIEP